MMVDINVKNGVYIVCDYSGCGKSYLVQEASNLTYAMGFLVGGITYEPGRNMYSLIDNMFKDNPKLVMIDRFDLYVNQEICSLLLKHKDDCVILVDYKYEDKSLDFVYDGRVPLKFEKERFVIGLDNIRG